MPGEGLWSFALWSPPAGSTEKNGNGIPRLMCEGRASLSAIERPTTNPPR
jgi:hypothetical protein